MTTRTYPKAGDLVRWDGTPYIVGSVTLGGWVTLYADGDGRYVTDAPASEVTILNGHMLTRTRKLSLDGHRVHCSCGARPYGTREMANPEAWHAAHLAAVAPAHTLRCVAASAADAAVRDRRGEYVPADYLAGVKVANCTCEATR